MTGSQCPCGAGELASCCGPLLSGERLAVTAEELMRSRYTAFALDDTAHLFRTWHPRTRPAGVDSAAVQWIGLEIIEVVEGGAADDTGIVEFSAGYREGRRTGRLHERSRFERRAGRWFYLDAT